MNKIYYITSIFALVTIASVNGIDTESEFISHISKMDLTNLNEATAFVEGIFYPYSDRVRTLIKESIKYRGSEPRADFVTCDVCKPAVPLIRTFLAVGATPEFIINVIINVCLDFDLAPAPELCDPTIRAYAEPTLFILQNRTDLTMGDFCGILNPGCTQVSPSLTDWQVIIDGNKPPVGNKPIAPIDVATTKILQFTDVHLDLDYVEGMTTRCDYPTCCRESNGPPTSGEEAAGPFGTFGCELPIRGLQAVYDHASALHQDVKYILLTGDFIHSLVWLYGKEENTRHIEAVTTKLREAFPNTPIFPVTGNHEPDVVNMYPHHDLWGRFDLSWMYQAVSAPFEEHIPSDQLELFRRGGYYTVTPEPGFRFVVINTNLCYINNFWLAYDAIDPENQLQWFSDTLLEAERNREMVYVVGHILPGSSSCWPVWSVKFDDIINRFEGIIQAQFYGHSHTDFFTLAFEKGTERAISTSYSCPSTVTDGMHAGYKVYLADGEREEQSTWQIMNHETWILNITQSNADGNPVYERVYNAAEDYELELFTPEALYDFVYRMIGDDEMFQKYHRNYFKGVSPRYRPCNDKECKIGYLCSIVTSISGDDTHCERIREAFNPTPTTSGPETTPTGNPGTTPTEDPGTTPTGNPGTTPTEDPGTTPTEDPGTTPTGNPGTTPTEDPGTTPKPTETTPETTETTPGAGIQNSPVSMLVSYGSLICFYFTFIHVQ